MTVLAPPDSPTPPAPSRGPAWWQRPGGVATALGWLFVACVVAAILIPAEATYTLVTSASRYEIKRVESRTATCLPALPFVNDGAKARPPQAGDQLMPGSSARLRSNACGITRGERYKDAFEFTLLAVIAFRTAGRRRRDFTVEEVADPRRRDFGEKAAALVVLIVAIPLLLATLAATVYAATDGASMGAAAVGSASAVLAIASVKAWRILQMP